MLCYTYIPRCSILCFVFILNTAFTVFYSMNNDNKVTEPDLRFIRLLFLFLFTKMFIIFNMRKRNY